MTASCGSFPDPPESALPRVAVTSVSGGSRILQAMGVVTSGNIDAVNLGGSYPAVYAV